MTVAAELPADYYLTNFLTLMKFVTARYKSLLSAEEDQFYERFMSLGINGQKLYVRLLSRKGAPSSAGALFRLSKLQYAEIEDLEHACRELEVSGLLRLNPQISNQELLPLFTKPELFRASNKPLPKALKRADLIAALLEQGVDSGIHKLLAADTLLAVQHASCFETFKLCFFGNLNQDLTDYVLRDLGLFRYEDYPLDRQNLPFQNREQIDQHLTYYHCLDLAEQALTGETSDILTLAEQLPSGITGDAALHRRLDRLRLKLARQLERMGELAAADRLYKMCQRPPARERRARIAIKNGDTGKGLGLCQQILEAPLDEAEKIFAESFGHRTAKDLDCAKEWPAPKRYRPPTETIVLPQSPERVEIQVALHLEQLSEGNCYYVENCLLNGILGLYIWDILFASIPGAFFNPFQSAPSDFRTADFYLSRRTLLDQRLAELDKDTLRERVWCSYRDKWGISNPLVAWDALPKELVTTAMERIPTSHWRSLFQRILSDIAHHRNGLPDLILFPAAGDYELIEVKGPGDRLQQNQQRWLTFFASQRVPHRVIHVEWQ
ncbi:fanconi-associated nuclease 1 homolog [Microbulbifer sp. NBRC 101763]|uniref:VRR-NUC domain-containing protein n=1 Tax=Microbulbifer sp. NBRC 101763 TaxID=1113820 RepID=UPI00309FE463